MNEYHELAAEVAKLRAAYHEAVESGAPKDLAEKSTAIKAMLAQMDELARSDAGPCPLCGAVPHGRLKSPSYVKKGKEIAAVWSVQCLTTKCGNFNKLAIGSSPKVAAFAWNQGEIR